MLLMENIGKNQLNIWKLPSSYYNKQHVIVENS